MLEGHSFDVLLLDEASQMVEPLTLKPLSTAKPRCTALPTLPSLPSPASTPATSYLYEN